MNPNLRTHTQPNEKIFNNKYQWYKTYEGPVNEMYNMIVTNIEKEFPHRVIEWGDKEIRREFINMIYENSSRHISMYVQ